MRKPLTMLVCLLALVVGSCNGTTEETTTTTSTPTVTTEPVEEPTAPVYRIGLTRPVTTINWWAAMDTEATAENQAVAMATKAPLFTLTRPGFVMVPALAATTEPVPPRAEGDIWVVEQPMRDDVVWSDGEQITADDLVFYFDVVRDFGLGSDHVTHFPDNVSAVSAVDDFTLRVEFDEEPGLADWQSGVAMAPFVPSHFWAEHVAASAGAAALYSIDPHMEPSIGPVIVEEWGEGVVAAANESYHATGTEVVLYADGAVRMVHPYLGDLVYGGDASGTVEAHYVAGPFVSGVEWREYEDDEAAYAALVAGTIDFVFDPDGVTLHQFQELAAGGARTSVSESTGFRFLAFNLRKPPMSDPVFREAMATVIDKDLLAGSMFGGTIFPAHSVVHPGLVGSFNAAASRPGWSSGVPMGEGERYETAMGLLAESGYTWAVEPEVRYDAAGQFVDVVPGSGLTMPNGVAVPELTILVAPVAEEDPMRVTFALWIAQWMTDIGMVVSTESTDLGTVSDVAVSPLSAEAALSWDLHVLGWGAADPVLPGSTLVALFHSLNTVDVGGLNTTGYQSAEFDAAAEAFLASRTVTEAAGWTREMESIVAEDLPYVTLYRPPLIEAYGANVSFPVRSIMGGHAVSASGWPEAVRIVR